MVTIKDVAQKANVGVGTVSRVINERPAVSPDTRQRVLKAIEDLNYSPNITARRLSMGKTWQIAVILPYLTLPSYVERLRGVQKSLGSTEYYPILYSVETPQQQVDYLSTLSDKTQVDGLLLISMPISKTQTKVLLKNRVPTVLIDASNDHLPHIIVDDVAGGRLATQHLIDLGHQRIGFLSDYLDTPFQHSGHDRFIGYQHALEQAGIPFLNHLTIEGERGRKSACSLANQLLRQPSPPTAIVAASDTHAIGILDAAKDLGIKVPEELSIVGYDNIRDADYMNLTTVSQPLFESGAEGASLLLEIITSQTVHNRNVELPLELIVRGTTAPPKTR